MTKKVAFGPKPAAAITPDQWVESRTSEAAGGERIKRLLQRLVDFRLDPR